jgi:hypothetical protein
MEDMYSAWEAGPSAEKTIFHKKREFSILMMKKKLQG